MRLLRWYRRVFVDEVAADGPQFCPLCGTLL